MRLLKYYAAIASDCPLCAYGGWTGGERVLEAGREAANTAEILGPVGPIPNERVAREESRRISAL